MNIIEMIDSEIATWQKAKALLLGSTGTSAPRTRKSHSGAPKRVMSPEGRARIAAAQKLRWAKTKRKAA